MQTDFQIFLGEHHISLTQEWVTHFQTFPHMAALNYCEPDVCHLLYDFLLLLYFNLKTPKY